MSERDTAKDRKLQARQRLQECKRPRDIADKQRRNIWHMTYLGGREAGR